MRNTENLLAQTHQEGVGFKKTVRLFILLTVLTILLVGGLVSLLFYVNVQNERETISREEIQKIRLVKQRIYDTFGGSVRDLAVLASQYKVKNIFNNPSEEDLDFLEHEFIHFSEISGLYDQVRFIDVEGLEKVRVNLGDGFVYAVPREELQNKRNRYYVERGLSLDEGHVYISPFDLNIEHGEIELPYKPMVRLVASIFSDAGERKGMIVLNYLGSNILEQLIIAQGTNEWPLELVNSDGYFFKSIDPENDWAFMFESRGDRTLQNERSRLWGHVTNERLGQFRENGVLYTYARIEPLLEISEIKANGTTIGAPFYEGFPQPYEWYLISRIDDQWFTPDRKERAQGLGLIALISILLVLAGALVASHSVIRRRIAVNRQVRPYDLFKIINRVLRHDILGKLSIIRGGIEMDGEKRAKGAQLAHTAALSGIDLVQDMRQLETLADESVKLVEMDVRPLVEEVIKHYDIPVEIEGDVTVFADEGLKSAIDNIIKNAVRHSGTDKIDITLSESNSHAEIVIADHGKGIPEEAHEMLFEEDFKYGKTANTGLGLYIVDQMIKRYGGSVEFKETEPQGATFIIKLKRQK